MKEMERKTTGIYTERKAIQEEIAWIREERRRLHDRYFELLDRLKVLDEREVESVDPTEVISRLMDITDTLSELVPKVPVQNLIHHLKDNYDTSAVEQGSDEDNSGEKGAISSKELLLQKMRDDSLHKGRGNVKYKYQVELVVDIMKELGRPAQLYELKQIMEDRHSIVWSNPTNAMISISKYEPRLEKIGYGTYQLKL